MCFLKDPVENYECAVGVVTHEGKGWELLPGNSWPVSMQGKELIAFKEKDRRRKRMDILATPIACQYGFHWRKKDLKEFWFARPSETQLWHQVCGKREICHVKEEVFHSCQGGGERKILGVLSPQGLACNYFMLCQFIRTAVCFPSIERRQQIGDCAKSITFTSWYNSKIILCKYLVLQWWKS